jgi:L-iditol 2-dehydrogenase
MAEYCAVPADKCFKLPDNVSFEDAALLDCISVAEHAVKLAQVSNEDTIAVSGAGTIGLLAVKAALLAGAREVHAIGTHDFQLKVAKDFGATSTINALTQKPVDRINELTGGSGVDKVIEAVGGASSAVSDGLSMLRRRGTLVTTGIFTKPITIEPFGFLTKELVMRSAWGYEHWTHMKEFALSLDLLARGKLDAKRLVTHRYPLNEAPTAFDAALNKEKSKSIKVQIVMPK